MLKFFHFPTFILSLAVGLFFVYISAPKSNVIYVYPTPDNINKIQYKDKGGTCHQFSTVEVACPKDKSKIADFPVN